MLAPVLALAICTAYAASLWWLLRRESAAAIAAVVGLCGVALAVRIWYTNDFPAGLIEDEPKMLHCAGSALKAGHVYDGECVGMPLLFWTVFQAQLVPLVGATRWAVRSFSLVTSVLSVPAAYAVGRGLLLAVAPSLGIAALVASLPWAIFYGRIALGGELVFHQLLLLAALVRFVWASGSWPDILVGGVGLCGLLHDYFCGRAMLPMTLVAAVLARGRYRLFCVAVLVIALIGWLPYVMGDAPSAAIGMSAQQARPGATDNLLETLRASTYATVRALVAPAGGRDGWFTVRSATIHPVWLLALALLGSLTGGRRSLFLWAAFLGGLAPSIVSEGQFPSAHRMLMALPVIAIAVGCALNLVPTRVGRAVATLAVTILAGVWGGGFYFSPAFWPVESQWVFSPERTALVEALPAPPHPRLIIMEKLGYFFELHTLVDRAFELLTVDNWVPADDVASLYAFDPFAAPLRPFYEQLVGTERIRTFGTAFTVSFEARPWSWIRQHGWAYEARCGTAAQHAVVPALYHEKFGFATLQCSDSVTHSWRGRWKAAAAHLRLYFTGAGMVETRRSIVGEQSGEQVHIDFHVLPEDQVRITLVTPRPASLILARLMELTPSSERVPVWESVDPILDDGASAAETAAVPGPNNGGFEGERVP